MVADATIEGDLRAYTKFNKQALNNTHKATDASGVVLAALIIQLIPSPEVDEGLAEDAWREAMDLASTATRDELLDTGQLLAELFYKLYHERSVTIFGSQALCYACRCSRERVNRTHVTFPRIEIKAMYVDEELSVTYEYCGTEYAFGTSNIETLFSHQ